MLRQLQSAMTIPGGCPSEGGPMAHTAQRTAPSTSLLACPQFARRMALRSSSWTEPSALRCHSKLTLTRSLNALTIQPSSSPAYVS
eukprot:1745729-Prorocentrum_lima.AAC.1